MFCMTPCAARCTLREISCVAALDRQIEPGAVFGRHALWIERERPVDQLDMDPAIVTVPALFVEAQRADNQALLERFV
jgi:hypothetical protein